MPWACHAVGEVTLAGEARPAARSGGAAAREAIVMGMAPCRLFRWRESGVIPLGEGLTTGGLKTNLALS
jgi:hypothetical protein